MTAKPTAVAIYSDYFSPENVSRHWKHANYLKQRTRFCEQNAFDCSSHAVRSITLTPFNISQRGSRQSARDFVRTVRCREAANNSLVSGNVPTFNLKHRETFAFGKNWIAAEIIFVS